VSLGRGCGGVGVFVLVFLRGVVSLGVYLNCRNLKKEKSTCCGAIGSPVSPLDVDRFTGELLNRDEMKG